MKGAWVFWVFVGLIVALVAVALLLWFLWWLWKRREQEVEPLGIELKGPALPEVPAVEEALPTPEPAAVAFAQDDLEAIEGIGPKIAGVLRAAGIATFTELANTTVDHLRQVLEQADPRLLRLADPATWPEQARLAAAGDWEALQTLQDELKGGRRE